MLAALRIAIVLLATFIGMAWADERSEFTALLDQALAHQRVLDDAIRTGKPPIASAEIVAMREIWAKVGAQKRPAAFDCKPERYTTILLSVTTRLVGISLILDMGRVGAARQSLEDIRADTLTLRNDDGAFCR